jgi:hypothetical protein
LPLPSDRWPCLYYTPFPYSEASERRRSRRQGSVPRESIKANSHPPAQCRFPENAGTSVPGKNRQSAGSLVPGQGSARIFRSFADVLARVRPPRTG